MGKVEQFGRTIHLVAHYDVLRGIVGNLMVSQWDNQDDYRSAINEVFERYKSTLIGHTFDDVYDVDMAKDVINQIPKGD